MHKICAALSATLLLDAKKMYVIKNYKMLVIYDANSSPDHQFKPVTIHKNTRVLELQNIFG